MRVPLTNSELISATNPKLTYEPTSVLDLRRSPSPVALPQPHDLPLSHFEDLHNLDWDSLISDLNDPQPSDHLPFISPNFPLTESNSFPTHSPNFLQLIAQAADSFDSNQFQLAHSILNQLNHQLHSPTGKPVQRAAFFFKQALQSLLTGSNRPISSWTDIVNSIKAHKAFSSISPIPMFSHFTTNQALLESLSGSSFIHIVDFDLGFGNQYASFMKEIAQKSQSPILRITAILTEDFTIESRLIRENLCQFAHDLKIRFYIDLVPVTVFESESFESVRFMEGEKTAILLSPSIFQRLKSVDKIAMFFGDLRRISPAVVVFVDGEGCREFCGSFRENLMERLEFYAMVMESVEAAGGDWGERIEEFVVRKKIMGAVEGGLKMAVSSWREVFHGAGMKPVKLSQFADFQAECLLGKLQVRGFQVGRRHAELVLCWNERPLVATSAWRC